MASERDIERLERLQRYRLIAVIAAAVMLVIAIVFDTGWLDWPRAAAWGTAAVISLIEARLHQRLGHSTDGAYLRAVVLGLAALITLL
ncbi:MAG: hypothetical protein IT378_27020 [Sandaracinaceae bacterium]|nr:hypothetical protein [Sandaracinaceae bacterium]